MTTRTTIRSWPAMGLAGLFVAGTSFVLFNDLLEGAKLTTSHVLTALALIAATAAGHQIVTMFRARRAGVALGMVILTAAALAYVATMSGARNAEQAALKAERIEGANAQREALKAQRDAMMPERERSMAMLEAAQKAIAVECASGEGTRCKGRRATAEVYANALAGIDAKVGAIDARLEALGGPQTPNAGYKAAAEAMVLLPWFAHRNQADLERALIVLLPWLAVLIAELGTIVFLSSALGHKEVATISDTWQTSFSADDFRKAKEILTADQPENDPPVPPTGGGKPRGRKTTDAGQASGKSSNVVLFQPTRPQHEVVALLEKVGSVRSNKELARLLGCSEGEARKRRGEVAHLLEEGWLNRCRTIALKPMPATA